MGDQDFNFNPPPRREANKAFEPPPWEKEQFEELARRKEAEQIAAAAVTEATAQSIPAEPTQAEAQQGVDVLAAATAPAPAAATEPGLVVREGTESEDDPRIAAMLIGLRNEEPAFGEDIWKVSIVAGSMVAVIGVVFVVWGLAAMAATKGEGATGSLGGGVLIVLGLMFVGGGMWMVFRTLRQRGVL